MATRAVNKTAKEGEQNARLLLSRGALSAMAIFRRAAFPSVRRWRDAPRRTRCSLQPRQHSVFRASGGGVLQVLPSAPFLCGEGGSYLVRGESKRSSMARSSRMRSRATGSGNILARCVLGRSTMAKCSRDAFPSVRRWRDCALMRSWPDWQWQYSRAVRSRASIRGKIPPRCVPGRQSVAIFSSHASPRGLRTGKSPVRGKIRAPCIRNELALARYARHASEKPRKQPFGNTPREDPARKGRLSLHGPLESCIVRRSCHPASTKSPSARNPCAADQRQTARAPATPAPPNSVSRQS